jgi:glutathione S-transferase
MMKLITTNTSPFGRKIRILMQLLELQEGKDYTIDKIVPRLRPVELVQHNVLARIPTLVLEDGSAIIDSQLIREYLLAHYSTSAGNALIPSDPAKVWEVKNLAEIAQGLMECTIDALLEGRRPEQYQYPEWSQLMQQDMRRTIAYCEENAIPEEGLNLYSLTLICALDFIDFRIPNFNWKKDCSRLSAWHSSISQLSCIKNTYPTE